MCWVWLNTLIYHAQELEEVGLADMTQQWICRLVIRHRCQFRVADELRLLDLFLTLPPGWLARWASKLLKLPAIDYMEENSLKDTLFYVEMALCSVSDKLVVNDSKSASSASTPNLPASLMPIEDEEVPASPSSANSSEFSFGSFFILSVKTCVLKSEKSFISTLSKSNFRFRTHGRFHNGARC